MTLFTASESQQSLPDSDDFIYEIKARKAACYLLCLPQLSDGSFVKILCVARRWT